MRVRTNRPGPLARTAWGVKKRSRRRARRLLLRLVYCAAMSPSANRQLPRRILVAIFLLLAFWRWSLPAHNGPFTHFVAAAYAHEGFRIVDPDEARQRNADEKTPLRKYDTFAHRVLDIDSGESAVSPAKYALLDSIIDDAKKRINYDRTLKDAKLQRAHAERILHVIDQVLTEHNVLYPPGDYDVESLRAGLTPQLYDKKALDRILGVHLNQRRREHARAHAIEPFFILDCDTSSFVYVGIAEAIGIDLHLVDLPNHMFVRWPLADGTDLNWDPNIGGSVADDRYASDYSLGQRIRQQRVYLATMTRREGEGFAYFLRAMRYEDRDENPKAIADLEKARELYPQSTQTRSELAWLYATAEGVNAERRKEAVDLAQAAVDMEPQCGDFWDSLAVAHAANGDFELAAKEARQAEVFAATRQDRVEFKSRRKAFEKGEMPETGRPH